MSAYDIIKRPILTEKSYSAIEGKRYTFEVALKATKTQIKAAIEEMYPNSKVVSVNTMIIRGKLKRQGRTQGMTPKYKKAIITLSQDSKALESFANLM